MKLRLILALCLMPATALADQGISPHALSALIPPDRASREISVVVDEGLRRTIDLPRSLRQARRDMLAGVEIAPDDLRALADRGDGLAALRYSQMLAEAWVPGSESDIAYYSALAVRTGRIWPLADAIEAMLALDPATEPRDRVQLYMQVLYPHAWAGNALALDALIDLNGEGRLFGALSAETLARIEDQAAQAGDGRAYLRLALVFLQSDDPAAQAGARRYLDLAALSDHLAVRTTAETLRQGLPPAPEPVIAME
jgi:hypothetical protein